MQDSCWAPSPPTPSPGPAWPSSTGVVRLDKDKPPAAFNPYEAIWGAAREGRHCYICATFNFDGPGKSGSFQNVRGLYLIDRRARNGVTYYTLGNIGAADK